MAQEVEIIINQADLDDPDSEFGLNEDELKLFDDKGNIKVNVFIDDEPAEPKKKTDESIAVKRKSNRANSTVIVTTNDGKVLSVLRYKGNKKVKTDEPIDNSATLTDIAAELKRIADAIPPLTKH
jgi:hypothetical protein